MNRSLLPASIVLLLVACKPSASDEDETPSKQSAAVEQAPELVSTHGQRLPSLADATVVPVRGPQLVIGLHEVRFGGKTLVTFESADGSFDPRELADDIVLPVHTALAVAAKSSDDPVAIIGDGGVRFSTLATILETARRAGFREIGLVGETAPGTYGMLPMRLDGERVDPTAPMYEVFVIIVEDGFRVWAGGGVPAGNPWRPTVMAANPRAELEDLSRWDMDGLRTAAAQLHGLPGVPRRLTVSAEASIPLDILAATLVSLDPSKCPTAGDECRFDELVIDRTYAPDRAASKVPVGAEGLGLIGISKDAP